MKTVDEYLSHCYSIPETPPALPLPAEAFAKNWKEAAGKEALDFLTEIIGRNNIAFPLKDKNALRFFLKETLGGALPVIVTGNHGDFRNMEAVLNGRNELSDIPVTVNAFTLVARADKISGHRMILLGQAPYSNIPARSIGMEEGEWMEGSYRLRLAHECAHYEMLRLFGDMQNHALDEIVADAAGQIAAFGNFSAERQRLFFGLEHGTGRCTGRLSFYCRSVLPWERENVYRSVDTVLDIIEAEVMRFLTGKTEPPVPADALTDFRSILADKKVKYELLALLSGTSIAERIGTSGNKTTV